MTDTESDLSNSNVFTFQSGNTTVNARGPNTNTNFSFRNNQFTSSMYMPRNFGQQRYAESVSDQRSIYYRRETSPMSIHSACDIRPRNFQPYYNGMGSHQSVFNGRSGSPVSMRSIDSSASVSAADIAFAFKNIKFNKYDLRVIKDAYNKLMKQRFRKRIEKRRNMRLFLKGSRHRSGDDSGEQGSDSSISSDDCRSVKTSYKENMSCNGSARMNLTDFRKTFRDNTMLQNHPENFKQSNFKNMFSLSTVSRNQNPSNSIVSKPNNPVPTLKDRFKNGFVLPSQRFINRSVASSVILENSERLPKNMELNYRQDRRHITNKNQDKNCESGSEEEIFSGVSIRDQTTYNTHKEPSSKRSFESDDDSSLPNKKKSKISSPIKNFQANRKLPSKPKNNSPTHNIHDENSNNFEFAKPTLPVRKSRSKIQEKVIAKSKQPLTGFVEHISNKIVANSELMPPVSIQEKPTSIQEKPTSVQEKPTSVHEKPNDNNSQDDNFEASQSSDVSARPSFTKRKLFTQTLDVTEKANSSSDGLNSPQTNVYSGIQKERNKARKLVTSQSCLNREVQDDNNLLDLIHKIVPPDRMNVTNQTTANQTKVDANNSNKKDDEDKWDVTSVISMCNENDVSDTFTDEEIFQSNTNNKDTKRNKKAKPNPIPKSNKNTKTNQNIENSQELPRECRIVVENIDCSKVLQKTVENKNINLANTNVSKPVVKSSAKTFWDTDFESDAECLPTQRSFTNKSQTREILMQEPSTQEFKKPAPMQSPSSKSEQQVPGTSRWLNNTHNSTVMNNTLNSTRKFNISTLSVRTHRATKKKQCCNETCFQEKTSAKLVTVAKSNKTETKHTSKPEVIAKIASKPEIENKTSKTTLKPEIGSKTTPKSENKSVTKPVTKSTTTSQNSSKTNKNKVVKSSKKDDNKNKTPAKSTKTKSNIEKPVKSRSTSRTRQKSKETASRPQKQIKSAKTISTQLSPKDRPIRSCRTPSQNRSVENSKSSRQFDISPLNITRRLTRKNISFSDTSLQDIILKTKNNGKIVKSTTNSNETNKILDNQNTKPEVKNTHTSSNKAKSKSNKSIATVRSQKSPQNPKLKSAKKLPKNVSIYQTPKCERPIRSCRTPGQNKFIDNYKSSIRGR